MPRRFHDRVVAALVVFSWREILNAASLNQTDLIPKVLLQASLRVREKGLFYQLRGSFERASCFQNHQGISTKSMSHAWQCSIVYSLILLRAVGRSWPLCLIIRGRFHCALNVGTSHRPICRESQQE